jgi:hypothetical protein
MLADKNDAKKVFLKKGTCSQTFFYLMNREFGHYYEIEEKAADPFAGGIMQRGYQCGMLWGVSLSAGTEAYRRCCSLGKSIKPAVDTTQKLMESFKNHTKSHDCMDITDTDFNSKFQFAKFMIFKANSCFNLAKEWAPEAAQVAKESLDNFNTNCDCGNLESCASVLAKKMGATDHQAAMVAGFAGGMGLSGNACGALCVAIWMKSMEWCRKHPGKSPYSTPEAKAVMEVFNKTTDYSVLCSEITGRSFSTIEEHTEYINNGGCKELIEALANT